MEVEKGIMITEAVRNAIDLAIIENTDVTFVFNDVTLVVSSLSYFVDICKIYDLQLIINRYGLPKD